MAQSTTYESWEEFLDAVREGFDPTGNEVTIEYDSNYSPNTQTLTGEATNFHPRSLGKAFTVETEDGKERLVDGWHISTTGYDGRAIGRIETLTIR